MARSREAHGSRERPDAERPVTATYAFLGPEGTFTEAALLQIPEAANATRVPASSVNAVMDLVRSGYADGAMVPVENSVEGGVTATLDAIATGEELRITREVLIPISFVLVAAREMPLSDVRSVSTHSHAWAQCRGWAEANIPNAEYVPGTSTAAAAVGLLENSGYDAAICSPLVASSRGLTVLAENIGDVAGAVTRFILLERPGALPKPTGSDKTTVVVPLPEDRPGALMEILDQLGTRGVNLSRIESRPTGAFLGDYFFSIDAEGHIADARVADALRGLHRLSPGLRFLGSYPRADGWEYPVAAHTSDDSFQDADSWVKGILEGR